MRHPSAGGPSAAPAFVGRAHELAVLHAALDRARAGEPAIVDVVGEAGTGKTALLDEFVGRAAGIRVAAASGDADDATVPFAALDQLLLSLQRAPAGLDRPNPIAAGAALLAAIDEALDDAVLVLRAEDAHWWDVPSQRALAFALRRLTAERVLAIVTARPDLLLQAGLARLLAERADHLVLGGFDAADIVALGAALDGRAVPLAAARRLVAHTGGHPLYSRAVLAELGVDGLLGLEGPLPVPSSYAALVEARLDRCIPEAVALVEAVAVLGGAPTLGHAARIGGVDDPWPALGDAIARGLLEQRAGEVAAPVSFPHPLVRAAVYHHLGPARRAELHRRAADAADGPVVRLRHLAAASAGDDDELAAALEEQARRELLGGGAALAATLLFDASRLATSRARRASLLLDAVDLWLSAGDPAAGPRRAAVLACPDGPQKDLVLARYAFVDGRFPDAEALLERAWGSLDVATDPADIAGRVCALQGQLQLMSGRGQVGIRWARRLAGLRDDELQHAAATGLEAIALGQAGRPADGLACVDGLPDPLVEPMPCQYTLALARGLLRCWTWDLRGALADFRAITRAARRTGQYQLVVLGLMNTADTEYRLGAWDDAAADAELAVSTAEDSDQAWMLAIVHAVAARIAGVRGDWARADAHLRAARHHGALRPNGAVVTYLATAGAEVALRRGDFHGVLAAVEDFPPSGDVAVAPGIHLWQLAVAEARARRGERAEADAVLDDVARAYAAAGVTPPARLYRVRAEAAGFAGDRQCALGWLARARVRAEETGERFERAVAIAAEGAHLRRQGDRRAAAARLEEARAELAAIGAAPSLERCDRELAACGLTPSSRRAFDPAALTPQELAVARLVASGLTNREVAAELVISVKTVEFHLSKVFAKLGVRSRAQLAAHRRVDRVD